MCYYNYVQYAAFFVLFNFVAPFVFILTTTALQKMGVFGNIGLHKYKLVHVLVKSLS